VILVRYGDSLDSMTVASARSLPEGGAIYSSETVERRLRNLARNIGLEDKIK